MKYIYLVSNTITGNGYDVYDSAVIVASTPSEAKELFEKMERSSHKLSCKLIGTTKSKNSEVILGSYNPG